MTRHVHVKKGFHVHIKKHARKPITAATRAKEREKASATAKLHMRESYARDKALKATRGTVFKLDHKSRGATVSKSVKSKDGASHRFRTRFGPRTDVGFIAADAERVKRMRRGFMTKIGHRRLH